MATAAQRIADLEQQFAARHGIELGPPPLERGMR
jgi:hypothetical protein